MSSEALQQLRAEEHAKTLAEAVPPGHEVVPPARMQRLVSFEMANPPSLLQKAPKDAQSNSAGGEETTNPRRKREPKSEQWWRRFYNKTSDVLVLPPGIAAMLKRSAVDNLASVQSPLIANSSSEPSSSRRRSKRVTMDASSAVDLVTSRIMFMTTCSQSNVQNILLNVFFCMTSYHSDPSKWDKDYQALLEDNADDESDIEAGNPGNEDAPDSSQTQHTYRAIQQKKLPRMMARHYEKLWQDFQGRYPDFTIGRSEFEDMISAVRKRGRYVTPTTLSPSFFRSSPVAE